MRDAKKWMLYYAIWAFALTFLIGCDAEGGDFFDDMADLVKELVTVFLQWLMEG